MTRRFALFFIVLAMLSSCGPVRDRRSLAGAEALMPERPDSALAVLRGLQPRDLPGLHVRPLHALLLSEALDKNYIDLTDDSLALAAHKYFGEHGSKLHRLKSWYYLGRIRFNAGNYAEAVICYNKALEYAEALTNYHYMGLINREIANAYDSVWDTWHAVERLEASVSSFQKAGEQRYADYSRLALASGLWKLKRFDESFKTLDKIDPSPDDHYLMAKISETRFHLTVTDEKSSLEDILKEYYLDRPVLIQNPTSALYSEIAYVHQLSGNADSVDFYINKAHDVSGTKKDTLLVENSLSQIRAFQGNYKEAYNRLLETVQYQDSSVFDALRQSINHYQGNYYQNELRINAANARLRTQTFCVLIFLLVLITLFLILRNRRQRLIIIEEMARTSEVQQDLIIMSNDNKEIGRAVATLFENRLNILQTLSDKYDLLDEAYEKKRRENTEKLSRDELVDSFRDMMSDLRKDKDINISMEEILNSWKGGIMKKFRSVFGADSSSGIRMSEEDFYMAPYYFSGMKQKTISYLTNHTEHSIKERKRRIKQRIESLGSSFSEEKRLFLDNL